MCEVIEALDLLDAVVREIEMFECRTVRKAFNPVDFILVQPQRLEEKALVETLKLVEKRLVTSISVRPWLMRIKDLRFLKREIMFILPRSSRTISMASTRSGLFICLSVRALNSF